MFWKYPLAIWLGMTSRSESSKKVSDPYGTEWFRVEFPHPTTVNPIWHSTPLPAKDSVPISEAPITTDPPTLSINGVTGIIGFPAKTLYAGIVALLQLRMLGLNTIWACQVYRFATSATVRFMMKVLPGPKDGLMMLAGVIAMVVAVVCALTWFAVVIVAVMTIIASSMKSMFSILLCTVFLSFLVINLAAALLLRVVESNSFCQQIGSSQKVALKELLALVLLRFEAFGYEAYVFHVYDIVLYYIGGRVPVVRA